MKIPFNRPYITGKETKYISQAVKFGQLSGDGFFTKKCNQWLVNKIGCQGALLTHSGTAALEMAAILADIRPGDEVIMPSFTFTSTANAFVLRGAIPVFIDIRPDTLNLDERQLKKAITKKTKAIVPVHYAGIGCEMETIMKIAKEYNLLVIEDAAHALSSMYNNKPLGSFGHFAIISFHETKNIHCGEGGALLINDKNYMERAEIIREKGTNRSKFFRGEVNKYSWVDIGSSFLPSEINAAFLWAQMTSEYLIRSSRLDIWEQYHAMFKEPEADRILRRPVIPRNCRHNAHMYYILVATHRKRALVLKHLRDKGYQAIFHYVPLHNSKAGLKFSRSVGKLSNTLDISKRIIRLPLWIGLRKKEIRKMADLALMTLEQ
ncbi:MAG: dTDP-4-amino-4,6-dideoxygalactose transaminase [Candidatus Omnitrophica bacterium]|nr:dTDP-4-amino-4,6-dideoxygalactose transaminase [Candidatus Omnitrophota bacterium]